MYGNISGYKTGKDKETAIGQNAVLDTLSSDILCLQEFYNNKIYPDFDLIKKLNKKKAHVAIMDDNDLFKNKKGALGLAIFSRFPIVKKQKLYWPPNNNGLLAADLNVNGDTIRVINFQLRSMGIRVQKLLKKDNSIDQDETKNVITQLKDGFEVRSGQVAILEKWIADSPYPVIIAGDLNELPYGYAYGRLSKLLMNSFENTGFGFGFTYHKILGFLRIDNQFYDNSQIDNVNFETISQIPYSDHYPIKAWYLLKKRNLKN